MSAGLTPEEDVRVRVSGFDKAPVDDVQGMRRGVVSLGFFILGVAVGALLVVLGSGVWS